MIQNIRLYILDIIGSLYFDLPESNRRSKIGFWLSIFKYISTIKLKLCSEYIIRDENNFIGEKLMDSIGHNVEGVSPQTNAPVPAMATGDNVPNTSATSIPM